MIYIYVPIFRIYDHLFRIFIQISCPKTVCAVRNYLIFAFAHQPKVFQLLHILNRENTEQDNRTITSKEQAELICEDGKWYVLNRSELGSTYLEANRKLALEPGDVIVLGDRRFKFETE